MVRARWGLLFLASCVSDSSTTIDSGVADTSTTMMDGAADTMMTSDGGPPPRCDPTKPFGQPTEAAFTNINTMQQEDAVFLLPGSLDAYVSANRVGNAGGLDLYFVTRASTAVPFPALATTSSLMATNTNLDERRPILSSNGLTLYFLRGTKPFAATRATTSAPFSAGSPMTDLTGGGATDILTWMSPDGLTAYVFSDRNGPLGIFVATRNSTSTSFATPQPLNVVAANPVLTADELTMYVGLAQDIQVSTRASKTGTFSAPVKVAELSSPLNDSPAWVSADGCEICITHYFTVADASVPQYDLLCASKP